MVRRVALLLVLCVGCSIDEGGGLGVSDPDAGAPDAFSPDVGAADVTPADVTTDPIEEPSPPVACTGDASVCTGAVPPGWAVTAFAPNRATACPVNFTTNEVVANPLASAGACTCSCSVTTQPSCALGAVKLTYSGDNKCGTAGSTYNLATAGACTDFNAGTFTLISHHQYTKLGLTQGTCSGASIPDASKVGATGMRTCDPPPACAEDVCGGAVPAGMRACIVASGDVACPAGPFSAKAAVIGVGPPKLSCGTCSACGISQSACGNGTVKFWGDGSCTVSKGSITADDTCNATGGASGVNHFTYENPVQNVKCVPGTSSPAVDLGAVRTVCCRP